MKRTTQRPSVTLPPRAHYSSAQLFDFARQDLITDAECSENQAQNGPFYPEKGITAESLRAYAAECRAKVASMDRAARDRFVRRSILHVLTSAAPGPLPV